MALGSPTKGPPTALHQKASHTRARLLASLCLAAALSLVSLELLFRIHLFGWHAFSIEMTNSVHDLGVSGLVQASPYPEVVFELRPNLDTYLKLARITTNSAGLHDEEYTLEKPAGTVRVAVIGDSFTMPAGVELDAAYHTLLEKQFDRDGSGTSHEFLNFGVGGYTLRQYLGVMENKALAYEPDLILIGFCAINDHEIPPAEIFHRPYQPKKPTHPFFGLFSLAQAATLFSGSAKKEISEAEKKYMRETFSSMRALAAGAGVPVLVAHLSNKPEDDRTVRRIVLENGLNYVDVSAAFAGTVFSQNIIYPGDGHPNARAHRIFAERIYQYLRAAKLL